MLLSVVSVFAVIFVIPFVDNWPYNITFTTEYVRTILEDSSTNTIPGMVIGLAYLF